MRTWRVADFDKVVAVIQALNAVEWPQTRGTVRDLLEGFGWTPTLEGLGMLPNLGVTTGPAFLTAVEEQLTDVKFTVCDVFLDDEVEAKEDLLQDAFSDFVTGFRKLWGQPMATESTPVPEVRWSVDNGCVVKVRRTIIALKVEFTTPIGAKLDLVPDARL